MTDEPRTCGTCIFWLAVSETTLGDCDAALPQWFWRKDRDEVDGERWRVEHGTPAHACPFYRRWTPGAEYGP